MSFPSSRFATILKLVKCCILALAALPLAAQPPSDTAPVLSLEECIARALKKNFDLQLQTYATDNAREAVTIAKADFDPAFTANATRSASQQDLAATSLVGTRSELTEVRVGVTQKVATGANIGLSSRLNRNASNSSFSTLNPAYNSDFTVSVSQPLLKNAGPTVARSAINRSKIGLDRAHLDYKGRLLQVVRDTEAAYYNLAFAREQRQVRDLSLRLAEKLFEESNTRRNTGVATDLDVLQAEVGVANARRNMLLAVQSVSDRQDALLNLIGQFEFDAPLGTVSLAVYGEAPPVLSDSFEMARQNQPDYVSSKALIKQLEIDAQNAKSARLPDVTLGAAAGYNARDRNMNDSLQRLPDGDGYSWQFDLSVRIPWGLRADRARYRIALNNLQREQSRLQQVEQNLLVQVRAAVRSVETNIESVEIARKATQLSERQYELEKARFDAGLSTSRRVLEAQDDLEQARVAELQSRVTLQIAVAELHRLEGSSLERYRIPLAD